MKKIDNYLPFYLGCMAQIYREDMDLIVEPLDLATLELRIRQGCTIEPFLRPFPKDVTDEEFNEWTKLFFKLEQDSTKTQVEKWAERIKFLTSKEFDVFGLIQCGSAIDKTLP